MVSTIYVTAQQDIPLIEQVKQKLRFSQWLPLFWYQK